MIDFCPCLLSRMRTSLSLALDVHVGLLLPYKGAFNGCCDDDVGRNNKGEEREREVRLLRKEASKLNKGERRSDQKQEENEVASNTCDAIEFS